MSPDEPMLSPSTADEVLLKTPHVTGANGSGIGCLSELKCQLYAQSRALHFTRFGMEIPKVLLKECGPQNKSLYHLKNGEYGNSDPDVAKCLSDLVFMVARDESRNNLSFIGLNPPLYGEYDAIIPITEKGLMMNVGEVQGSVAFLGYRQFADGVRGPAEINNLVKNIGDKIISINGQSTTGKAFKDVIEMLRESGKHQFCYMRFYESKCGAADGSLCSLGDRGKHLFENVRNSLKRDRRKLLVYRAEKVNDQPPIKPKKDEESDRSVGSTSVSDDSDSSSLSEGELESDDKLLTKMQVSTPLSYNIDAAGEGKISLLPKEIAPITAGTSTMGEIHSKIFSEVVLSAQETTRSLALRLIDIDLGYSSDEGGEDNRCWFIDGVDCTFSSVKDGLEFINGVYASDEDDSEEEDSDCGIYRKKTLARPDKTDIPVKKNEFLAKGERSKIVAASTITKTAPRPTDFDKFPLSWSNNIGYQDIELCKEASPEPGNHAVDPQVTPNLSGKKSTTKIEQVSVETNEVLQIWATAAEAAATLQISLAEINEVLKGEYNEDIGDEAGGYRWRFADENAEVTAKIPSKRGKKGKQAFLEFREKLYDHENPRLYKGGHSLRDYQIDGVNWLASLWYKRSGCILADEMGLGKTVQIVCYIEHLHRVEKVRGPFLIVVPLSTVEHWRREFEGWTDLRCCVYHDRQREWRDVMREYEWYYKDRPHTVDYLKFDVLVTTYDTLIADFDIVGLVPWRVTVVDEAHRLRNVKGKLLECMKFISQRGTLQHGFQSRVLMTGTPLQNNMQELWTLLNFIEPFKFPSMEQFMHSYGNMSNRDQVEALQNAIAPFMLRRVKEDVAKDIPSKEETLIDVELTSIQKQYYRAIFEHNHTFLNMGASRASAPKLMNIQMELRKCCNHPFLLDGVEQRELERQHKEFLESGELTGLSAEEQQKFVHEAGYVKSSGKMVLLDKLLPKLRAEGHKVLIFSQMVKMLDLMSEFCDFRGFKYERLDGRIRGNERQKAIDRFNREEDSFVFLLSTRAGGVGINLTGKLAVNFRCIL
jgi:chromodomain-helicase-DNA-binding protein 7